MPHECAGGGAQVHAEWRPVTGFVEAVVRSRNHRLTDTGGSGGHLQVDTYWKEGGERGNRQDRIWVRATPNVVTTRLFL